ncbi:MAG: box helicase [Clostridia bacterium]|nr:box helicase [Clostridia bacterium]
MPTLQLLSEEQRTNTSHYDIRALILTPTRELAMQIYQSFRVYGRYVNLSCCAIFGGVSQRPQEKMLKNGVDILVATPGRLNDLINQKLIDLQYIKIFILDEADRMLDMGFINDVKKIIAQIPNKKQTLLFSATMPPEISSMANTILIDPVKIEVTPVSSTVDAIKQSVCFVDRENKKNLLLYLLKEKQITSALVFTRTKHGADRVVKELTKENINAQAIHGNKSQYSRQLALDSFKNKETRVLVATDIASRGIDIDELSHVINYDLPETPETYIHRIGRTGRAGLSGIAISFCDFYEKILLKDIENLIGKHVPEMKDHPYPLLITTPIPKTALTRYSSMNKSETSKQRNVNSLKEGQIQRKTVNLKGKTYATFISRKNK